MEFSFMSSIHSFGIQLLQLTVGLELIGALPWCVYFTFFPADVIKFNAVWIQICRPTRNEDTIDVLGAADPAVAAVAADDAVAADAADATDDVATADAQMNKK